MLSTGIFFPIFAQLPMAEVGQLLLVTGISFVIIMLITSTYRFHTMIQIEEDSLETVADNNDFFFIQVTRYLSKINRISTGFGVMIIQFRANPQTVEIQRGVLHTMQELIRKAEDKVCMFQDDCIGVIIDTEENRVSDVTRRMANDIKKALTAHPEIQAWRIGVSHFPMHGIHTQSMIDTAVEALEKTDFGADDPFCIAPNPKPDEKETPQEIGELSKEDKRSSIDPLTGVLKPAVIGSYMRKYLAELRRKKEPVSILCIGISRIRQITELHGETATDEVIAGVSQIIQKLTRDCDLIGRFHHADFMVLAPSTLSQGEMIAQRLRDAVQKEVFLSGGKRIKATVSIGISAHPEHGRNLRDLFRGAHCALEVIREWNTATCLVYNPAEHDKKGIHEPVPQTRG